MMSMQLVFSSIWAILAESWLLLQDASFYILIGLLAGGMLKAFLSPGYVAAHLGQGRFSSVLKAALLGIPLPLCSCGVLPAAASLKKQGASNGATTAFLIATPETGVDSIAISWVLLDPLMTLFRPVAAFVSALVAGIGENLLHPPRHPGKDGGALQLAGGLNRKDCTAEDSRPQGLAARVQAGGRYALVELWGDLAGPFFFGLLIAGFVAVLVPDNFFQEYLSGGLSSMLVMLVFGIPLYICATASTPIAAAFILKGVSPGAVLVFLLVGPATNIATITVLSKLLGKRSTTLYLVSIGAVSLLFGLALDQIYFSLGISAQAAVGKAAEITPDWLRNAATLLLLLLSVGPLARTFRNWFGRGPKRCTCPPKRVELRPLPMAGQNCAICGEEGKCPAQAAPVRKDSQQPVWPGK